MSDSKARLEAQATPEDLPSTKAGDVPGLDGPHVAGVPSTAPSPSHEAGAEPASLAPLALNGCVLSTSPRSDLEVLPQQQVGALRGSDGDIKQAVVRAQGPVRHSSSIACHVADGKARPLLEGPAPPENLPSTKAGNFHTYTYKTLTKIRADINKKYARFLRNKRADIEPGPQHKYNTRSKRAIQPLTSLGDSHRRKRTKLTTRCSETTLNKKRSNRGEPQGPRKRTKTVLSPPPPQGTDILGVNFPT